MSLLLGSQVATCHDGSAWYGKYQITVIERYMCYRHHKQSNREHILTGCGIGFDVIGMFPHSYEYCVGINDVVSEPISVANVCMVVSRVACFPQICSTSLHQWPN